MKRNSKTLSIIVIVLIFLCCGSWMVVRWVNGSKIPPWYSLTSPLEQNVVDDLCKKLTLNCKEQRNLCSGEKDVYADQFLYALRRTFPKDSTYDNIQEQLAGYQKKVNRLDNYTTVYYDFKGDDVILMEFYFVDNRLYNIFSDQNYDDWNPGQITHLTEEAALTQEAK